MLITHMLIVKRGVSLSGRFLEMKGMQRQVQCENAASRPFVVGFVQECAKKGALSVWTCHTFCVPHAHAQSACSFTGFPRLDASNPEIQ